MLRIKEQLNEDGSELSIHDLDQLTQLHTVFFQNILLMDGEKEFWKRNQPLVIHTQLSRKFGKPSFLHK
jgi:hypothetical protein